MENEEMVVNDYEEDVEDIENEEKEEETEGFAISTIGAMAIGSGLTLGGIALFKKLKTVVARRREKKNQATAESANVVDADVIEETDDQTEPKKESKKK